MEHKPQTFKQADQIRKELELHDDTAEIINGMYSDIDDSTRSAMDSGVKVPKLMEPRADEDPDQPTRQRRLKQLASAATGIILVGAGAEHMANQTDKDLESEGNFKEKSAEVTTEADILGDITHEEVNRIAQDLREQHNGNSVDESTTTTSPIQELDQNPDLPRVQIDGRDLEAELTDQK